MNRQIKIGFLTTTDPNDKRSWSGIHFAMLNELKKRYEQIIVFGPLDGGNALKMGKIRNRLSHRILKKRYDYSHSVSLSKKYAAQVMEKINRYQPDLLIAPSGSSIIAHLPASIPVILLSDTTLANMVDYYPAYSNLSLSSKNQSLETETLAIQKSAFAVFPSEWARSSAIKDHGGQAEKMKLIPFGPNFSNGPTREMALAEKKNDVLKLLFLGVDWHRKGGDLVMESFRLLQKKNIPVQLTIVGCNPPFSEEKTIRIIPFINKNDAAGEQQIIQLLLESHVLFLPSKAECYGIVFVEAAACGTPSLARNTGGISGAVIQNENGILLSESATAKEYADQLEHWYHHPTEYRQLQEKSRMLFEKSHNWSHWGEAMEQLISLSLEKGNS